MTKHPTAEHSIADDRRYFRRPGKWLRPYHRNSRAMHVRGAVDDIVAAYAAYIVSSMTPPPLSSIEAEDVVDDEDDDSSGPRSNSRSSSGEQYDVGAGKRERVMMGMTIIYIMIYRSFRSGCISLSILSVPPSTLRLPYYAVACLLRRRFSHVKMTTTRKDFFRVTFPAFIRKKDILHLLPYIRAPPPSTPP